MLVRPGRLRTGVTGSDPRAFACAMTTRLHGTLTLHHQQPASPTHVSAFAGAATDVHVAGLIELGLRLTLLLQSPCKPQRVSIRDLAGAAPQSIVNSLYPWLYLDDILCVYLSFDEVHATRYTALLRISRSW